jgi:hypothetical protein
VTVEERLTRGFGRPAGRGTGRDQVVPETLEPTFR